MTRQPPMICAKCAIAMNAHAAKPVDPRTADEARRADPATGRVVLEVHQCPKCGAVAARAG